MSKAEKDLNNYLERNKRLQDSLLHFLDNNDGNNDSFEALLDLITKKNKRQKQNLAYIKKNKEDLKHFLHFILTISNYHHRTQGFFRKIDEILKYFKENIEQNFSNFERFQIFYPNKEILLLLINENIIKIDQSIVDEILKDQKYCHFFMKEIQEFINKDKFNEIVNENETLSKEFSNIEIYNKKRLIGENDSTISSIIRDDLIDDFVSYTDQHNIKYSSPIQTSIYETNLFLIDKTPTLIEYATFYGAIQIFNFLYDKISESKKSLWLYAIHSNKIELIILLVEKKIMPEDETYLECFLEAIKCHHNDIAEYK